MNQDTNITRTIQDLAIEAMHRVYRVLTDQPDEILHRSRLQRAHHRILYVVARNHECSVAHVCELLHISRQAINGPLRALIDRQLVDLRPDEADRRTNLVRLTSKGKRLEQQLTDSMRDHFARAFSSAGPQAQTDWFEVMRYLSDPLQAMSTGKRKPVTQTTARASRTHTRRGVTTE